ncbi:MAG: murein biosynthesis integral membrane protein MurJ [Parcubacteria group bacterium CG_4_10_14_0_8_um_filter_35_7]|nr:MAG: murein biosynthesis integral membrane protein MurJ [Parcubacteria group bacterium CG23_combo_of_CG06-09_8_20_14_all_35_9]PIY78558.1 MAG: murein biosynthesis integral membrane protein MurJ [Parcubacteria group bacterium CG_4_10_14_0_8_um_filter_35_7]
MIRIFRQLFNSQSKTITGAAFIIGLFSLISRLLGIVRDRILAGTFGAGDTLDMYYAAFRIPDLVFNLIVLGALSAGFIPVFTEYLSRKNADSDAEKPAQILEKLERAGADRRGYTEAWELASNVLNITIVALIILGGFLFLLATYLMPLITPGFSGEKIKITVTLTRIMFLSPLFLGVSSVFGGVLQSFKRFFVYSLAPVMYNIGIIIGALFLVNFFAEPVYGLALGVILGAFLHMIIQVPSTIFSGFRWKWTFNLYHEGIRKIGHLMIPRTLGLATSQINLLVITIIASTLAGGSIAVFNFANNLQSFPLGIFGISFAIASFPTLSIFASQRNFKEFIKNFSYTFRQILFFIIPTSVLLLVLRAQIVRVILGTGVFDWEDTILVAQSLGFFSFSLFAQALIFLLARSFYALQNTIIPFVAALSAVVFNIIFCLILVKPFGAPGLALAYSIAAFINMALLLIFLKIRLRDLDDKKILTSTFKIIIASFIMAVVVQAIKYVIEPFVNMQTFLGVVIQGLVAGMVGLVVFVVISLILKSPEMIGFKEKIEHKFFRIRLPFIGENGA